MGTAPRHEDQLSIPRKAPPLQQTESHVIIDGGEQCLERPPVLLSGLWEHFDGALKATLWLKCGGQSDGTDRGSVLWESEPDADGHTSTHQNCSTPLDDFSELQTVRKDGPEHFKPEKCG